MKVNTAKNTALYEALDADNNTGVSTENLVKMVEARNENKWKRFNSGAEYFAYLDSLDTK